MCGTGPLLGGTRLVPDSRAVFFVFWGPCISYTRASASYVTGFLGSLVPRIHELMRAILPWFY
eukprot:scaffold132929_cov72-Attheya_sp.AAC.2